MGHSDVSGAGSLSRDAGVIRGTTATRPLRTSLQDTLSADSDTAILRTASGGGVETCATARRGSGWAQAASRPAARQALSRTLAAARWATYSLEKDSPDDATLSEPRQARHLQEPSASR